MSNGSPRPASRGVAASQGVRWAVQKPRSSLIFSCARMRDERANAQAINLPTTGARNNARGALGWVQPAKNKGRRVSPALI